MPTPTLPVGAIELPQAPWLFIQMSDDGEAFPTWCADEAEIRAAVAGAVYVQPLELDDDETEQVKGITDSLIEDGFFDFEGDPGLKLFRIAGTAPPAEKLSEVATQVASGEAVAQWIDASNMQDQPNGWYWGRFPGSWFWYSPKRNQTRSIDHGDTLWHELVAGHYWGPFQPSYAPPEQFDCLAAPAPVAQAAASTLVLQQAEDDGLWFKAQTAPEAYLQKALRDLHAAVEANPVAQAAVGAKSLHQIALENIACEKPRFEAASKLDGSGARMRCYHCGYAWQPDCKPYHANGCAYIEATSVLSAPHPEAPAVAPVAGVGEIVTAEPWLKADDVAERLKGQP